MPWPNNRRLIGTKVFVPPGEDGQGDEAQGETR